MRLRISSGGKIRVSTRRVSYSNRGGPRLRLGKGFSAGKSGVRYTTPSVGGARVSTGATGTRASVTTGAGPVYAGVGTTKSGPKPFFGITFFRWLVKK